MAIDAVMDQAGTISSAIAQAKKSADGWMETFLQALRAQKGDLHLAEIFQHLDEHKARSILHGPSEDVFFTQVALKVNIVLAAVQPSHRMVDADLVSFCVEGEREISTRIGFGPTKTAKAMPAAELVTRIAENIGEFHFSTEYVIGAILKSYGYSVMAPDKQQ